MTVSIQEIAGKLQRIGSIHAVGDVWFGLNEYVPAGVLLCNGGTYSKETYKDLWQWAVNTNQTKSAEVYNSLKTNNGGQCPYFCDLNETQFMMPVLSAYPMFGSPARTSFYKRAGLPNMNHKHVYGSHNGNNAGYFMSASSVITYTTGTDIGRRGWNGNGGGGGYESTPVPNSNLVTSNPIGSSGDMNMGRASIWGRSDTVTPETNIIQVGYYAVGSIQTIGTLSVKDSVAKLNEATAKLEQAKTTLNAAGQSSLVIPKVGKRGTLAGSESVKVYSTNPSAVTISGSSEDTIYFKELSGALTLTFEPLPDTECAVKVLAFSTANSSAVLKPINATWVGGEPPSWGNEDSYLVLTANFIAGKVFVSTYYNSQE